MEKTETNFSKNDIVFAFAMLACGFLYWNLIYLDKLGAGVTIFALVLFTATFVYLSASGYKQNRRSLICLGLAGLVALQFAIFDNQLVSSWGFVFLTALFVYWICLSTGQSIDKKLSVYIIGDGFKHGIYMPMINFWCCLAGIKEGIASGKGGKSVVTAAFGILIFLPLIVIVTSLLVSADHAFESFMVRFFEIVNLHLIITYFGQFIIGIPVAFYLYGMIYGNAKGRHSDEIATSSIDNAARIVRVAPKLTVYSGLAALNVVYLVFFAVQAAYLFSAFTGSLPETYTYAEYARRGFFEICTVAGINLFVLAASHLAIKRDIGKESKALKAATVIISAFTILLIATALSKMAMYISVYGLTQLRVITSWFMILLLIVFLTICARQFVKFNSARLIIVGCTVMFIALSYGNVDSFIAKYNIERYEAGTLSTLDTDDLARLSDAAAPHIYELYMKTDEDERVFRRRLESALGKVYGDYGFRGNNFQKIRADELRSRVFPKVE